MNVAALTPQLETALGLPVLFVETSEAVSRIFVGTGRNLFLSTLRSAIETIPPTPQPELAQPEGAAPAPPAGSPLPALIQNPAAPLRAVKQSAKEQAVAQSPTLESKTATLALAMPLALPVVSLGLQDSRSLPAPDSSEVYNVPDQSGTHAPRFGNDVVAVSGTDVERDATQLPAPVAFQLDLIATPALSIKEHPGGEAPALPNVSKTADRSPRPDLTALLLSAGASTLAINPATSSTFLQSPALAQISLPAQPGPAPQASSSVSQFLSTGPDIAAPTPESAASRPGSVPPPDPQVLSPSTGTAAPTAESAISRPGVAEMSTMTASAEKLDALVRSNAPAESFLRPAISASDRYLDSAAVSGSTASQPAISDAHGNKPFESRLEAALAPSTLYSMTVAPQANHTLSGCMPAPSGVAMPVMSGTRVSRSVMPVAEDHPNVAASRLSRDVAASNSNNSVPAGGARGAADFRARLAANGSMAADDTLRPLVPNTRTPEPIPGNKSDSLEGTFKIPTDAEGRSAPPADTRSSQGLLNLPVPLQAAVVSNATTPKPPQAPRRIWVSQSAAPESLPDSLRLQVPEPTQSRVVAGVSQRNFTNETAETTATVFQRRPSTTEPDLGYARASRIETPAISQPSPSNMNATAAFQNKSLSEDGAHRAAPSNAPAPESLARTVQPVRGPREGEPRQKDPEGPAAQKLGPEPAQARPASESNEVRLTVGAVQSGGPVTVRSVDEVPANAEASTPPPQHTIDPQFAIPAPPAATRQISLKLPGTGNVAVQLRERAGKIEVAVRSGDSQLTKSLQSGLGDLVMRLENQGFKTQAWVPAGARQTATGLGTRESSSSQQGEQSGTSSGNQQREAHSNSRRQPRPRARFEESLEDARMK